ncbi:MAG: EMC3/TMCO1 family protein [Candidatus Hadarchaeales archaeon]
MRNALILAFSAALLLSFTAGTVIAQSGDDTASLTELIKRIDTSIASFRRGDISGATGALSSASDLYSEKFSGRVAEKDNEIDNRIRAAFADGSSYFTEENLVRLFDLRSDVILAVGKIGVTLPPIYELSMLIILGVSMVVSFLVTLLNRRMVNWRLVREARARLSEFQEEYREASRKKDAKLMHKLQLRQAEVMRLQSEVMKQTMKPTLVYMIPLFVLWYILLSAYSGWVVAWLPFRIDLPFLGPVAVFGVGLWYFITYLGFSQVFRKIMIRD